MTPRCRWAAGPRGQGPTPTGRVSGGGVRPPVVGVGRREDGGGEGERGEREEGLCGRQSHPPLTSDADKL